MRLPKNNLQRLKQINVNPNNTIDYSAENRLGDSIYGKNKGTAMSSMHMPGGLSESSFAVSESPKSGKKEKKVGFFKKTLNNLINTKF